MSRVNFLLILLTKSATTGIIQLHEKGLWLKKIRALYNEMKVQISRVAKLTCPICLHLQKKTNRFSYDGAHRVYDCIYMYMFYS